MSNIALLHHFDDSETFSYSGNARNVQGGKFSKCSYFPDDNSFINISNHSGIFNLAPDKPAEFEFFVKPLYIARINSTQEKEMYDAGFRWVNGHSYRILSPALGWFDAKRACEAMQGHLAVFHDNDTHNFINSMISGSGEVWIGATYENGIINWIDGVQYSPNNDDWFTGQPDGHGKGIQLYNPAGSPYLFDDLDTAAARLFLCEWDFDTRFNSSPYSYYNWKHPAGVFNGHSFALLHSDNKLEWHDAQSSCVALGGHLATIPNADKNFFLSSIMQYSSSSLTDFDRIWVGGNDENQEGSWQWVTGENFSYFNWYPGEPNDNSHSQNYLAMFKNGLWDDTFSPSDDAFPVYAYLCEWDYLYENLFNNSPILAIGDDFKLTITHTGALRLSSPAWNIDAFSETTLNNNWNHVLLRLLNNYAYVFINGYLVINTPISGNALSTDSVTLGGFIGYLDEFIFRNGNDIAYSESVNVPVKPYGSIANNNAPITRVTWSCNNLPDGLTLSPSGLLSGHPTTAGTFDCNFSVSTNWGIDNKSIRIVIQ